MAVFVELNLEDGVHRPGVGRVSGRPVGRDAQLADDQLQIFAELLLDDVLDLRRPLLRSFRCACPSGRAPSFQRRRRRLRGRTRDATRLPSPMTTVTSSTTATPTVVNRLFTRRFPAGGRTSRMPTSIRRFPASESTAEQTGLVMRRGMSVFSLAVASVLSDRATSASRHSEPARTTAKAGRPRSWRRQPPSPSA